MQLEIDTIIQLANGLLGRMIDTHDAYYGLGTMTCSVYDTAWVSMVAKTEGNRTFWLFPQSFSFLLAKQLPDRGWAATTSPIDGILNTAAALLSLCRHRENPYQIVMDKQDLEKRIVSGQATLDTLLEKWDIQATLHVGFEILVPALLDFLGEYNMEFRFQGRRALYRLRDTKLSMLDLHSLMKADGSQHSVLHSLEALKGRVDFNRLGHHKVYGSIMASPSATAAYLIHATVWDSDSEAYLQYVLAHGEGSGSGSAPSAFPSTVFETTWVLSALLAGGMRKEELGDEKIERLLNWVHEEFEAQQGLLGFAPNIQPDADDTAKGIICLNMMGTPVSTAGMISSFGQGEWFKTYPEERHASISTNCSALLALLSDRDQIKTNNQITVKIARHLFEQWFQSSTIIDKWNLSSHYTLMLLAQALAQTLKTGRSPLPADQSLYEEDAPLVLFQLLIDVLQGQEPDGSWSHCKETTAYAMLTINAFRDTAQAELLEIKLQDALLGGRSFLANNYGSTQPGLLWVEKVTYGSRNLSEGYILAALHCSLIAWPETSSSTKSPNSWDKALAIGQLYGKLPLLNDVPKWLILACAIEGTLFKPHLRRRCQQILQDDTAEKRHLRFIPFTWTMVTRLRGADIAPVVQLDMMTISALLYTLDYHMEVTIGSRSQGERQAVRGAVNADLDYLESHGHLPEPASMDRILRQIVSYLWEHKKVQNTSSPDKRQLLIDIRLLLLAHLQQLDDNEHLREARKSGLPWKSTLRARHSSLRHWIQTTSGHHTGGGVAFSFFICLVSSGTNTLHSPAARYLVAKLSESLRTLSRIQNDYGSIERDHLEGNLNSADFFASPSPAKRNNSDEREPQPGSTRKSESQPVSESCSSKDQLDVLARHEKRAIESLLVHELPSVVEPAILNLLHVFVAAVEIYGQMYMLMDHTPRLSN